MWGKCQIRLYRTSKGKHLSDDNQPVRIITYALAEKQEFFNNHPVEGEGGVDINGKALDDKIPYRFPLCCSG